MVTETPVSRNSCRIESEPCPPGAARAGEPIQRAAGSAARWVQLLAHPVPSDGGLGGYAGGDPAPGVGLTSREPQGAFALFGAAEEPLPTASVGPFPS